MGHYHRNSHHNDIPATEPHFCPLRPALLLLCFRQGQYLPISVVGNVLELFDCSISESRRNNGHRLEQTTIFTSFSYLCQCTSHLSSSHLVIQIEHVVISKKIFQYRQSPSWLFVLSYKFNTSFQSASLHSLSIYK